LNLMKMDANRGRIVKTRFKNWSKNDWKTRFEEGMEEGRRDS
jgi:hypothetical protein